MKANKQSKIKIKNSGFKRSHFNWAHDVNTTHTWGEIQPTQCKMLIPGSKTTMSTQDLIRLAPMVAPTFGRVKYKTFNQFVALSEIFPNFDAFMAQEPVTKTGGTKVPNQIPTIPLGMLSSYVLFGAKASLYWGDLANATAKAGVDAGIYHKEYKPSNGNLTTKQNHIKALVASSSLGALVFQSVTNVFSNCAPEAGDVGTRVCFYPSILYTTGCNGSISNAFQGESSGKRTRIPLGVTNLSGLFDYDPSLGDEWIARNVPESNREVTLASADYVIEFSITDPDDDVYYIALAVELSDYGKRIRKILQGCGYQIDFSSSEEVSILPLIAQYKAYFDIFGLQLYQGWETTKCAKLISYIENEFIGRLTLTKYPMPNTDSGNATTLGNAFVQFMVEELGNEFYTEDADYIGAHISSLSVSPAADQGRFINVTSSGVGTCYNTVTDGGSSSMVDGARLSQHWAEDDNGTTIDDVVDYNGAAGFIKQVEHGYIDSELLKRMYKWVNRNTLLGREIAKLLRAQGLGKYVDECKSNFIGSTDTMITISDVVSQSDTFNNGTGAVLGEYGGRGIEYNASNTLVFENDVYGYWITLATIVPEAGYTQGLDPTLTCDTTFKFYQPDFDALGMEATRKETIVGNKFLCGYDKDAHDGSRDTFGFIPRMSLFKVTQNLVNGDFNRHNMRNTYLPYTLDKQLNVNDFNSEYASYSAVSGSNPAKTIEVISKSINTSDMPIAGNIWRTPTKYQWLGNFDRIFYNITDDGKDLSQRMHNTGDIANIPGFVAYNEDNFLAHSIYDVQCYAPMKPIEESYGDDENETGVTGVQFNSKA